MNKKWLWFNKRTEHLVTFALGFLAALTNALLVTNVYDTLNIHLGSTFVLFALLILPLRHASLVVFASVIPLVFADQAHLQAGLQLAEFFVVLLLLKNQLRFLSAISIFWAFFGLAVISIYLRFTSPLNIETTLFVAFTFALGNYAAALVALLAFWILPISVQRRLYKPQPPEFSKLIFELNVVSVILPVVLVTLFFIWRSDQDVEQQLSNEMNQGTQEINRSVLGLIATKLHTLQSAASKVTQDMEKSAFKQTLNTIAVTTQDIESMVLVDKDANVILAAPEQYEAMLPNIEDLSIAHRKYFKDTKKRLEPIVSRAIKGSGLGDLDIIALTAPVLLNGEFNGLVQAAITLDKLVDESIVNAIENNELFVLILDDEDSVIYASEILNLTQLTTFDEVTVDSQVSDQLQSININEQEYLYNKLVNERGWKLYVLAQPARMFDGIGNYIIFILVSMLMSTLFITLLSKGLAAKIIKPLLNLERLVTSNPEQKSIIKASKISKEMELLTKSVIEYQKLSEDFQRELKAQVEEKTQALQDANESLLTLSQTDALTGLYNRGAFDTLAANTYKYCQRHHKPFTLALLDIDHFKSINDTYGHIAGDECIKKLARLIEKKCRRDTDILARYGGEEFILLLASDSYEQHERYINIIHESVQAFSVEHDNSQIKMTVSGGVLKIKNDFTKEFSELLSLADKELYKSKHAGRNRLHVRTV